MHNKVVHTVARALQERGMPTLRFNYRGVGAECRPVTTTAMAKPPMRWRWWPRAANAGRACR